VTIVPGFCPVATALLAVNERGCRDGTGHRPVATTHSSVWGRRLR